MHMMSIRLPRDASSPIWVNVFSLRFLCELTFRVYSLSAAENVCIRMITKTLGRGKTQADKQKQPNFSATLESHVNIWCIS